MQKELKEGIVSEIKPISEGMKNSPKTITFPQFSSITAYDDDGEEEKNVVVGVIVEQYLQKFASVSGAYKTFGSRDTDGKDYSANKETKIKQNDIIVGGKAYVGTLRLLELIVAITPDDLFFTNGIMIIMLK